MTAVGASAEAVLKITDLSVAYGEGPEVVRSLDLTLAPGERLGLIGESGAGKSTVGLAVIGLLRSGMRITSGSVVLNGRELTGLSERDLRDTRGNDIALVYQDALAALDPVKSVRSQLDEAIRAHGDLDRAQREAVMLDAMAGAALPVEHLDSYPHELSGGLRQRVSIAMALANKPSVLIADEPTTALDVTTQSRVLAVLDELVKSTGTALILITHDLGVVSACCDTTAVMYGGRIVESGPTQEVFQSPRHPYTQALVRSVTAIGRSDLERLPVIEGAPPAAEAIPSGCAFAPRCERRDGDPLCVAESPTLAELVGAPHRKAACWHVETDGSDG
ncbi:MAG TPA: ABC transporter ATP-binding protein [Conexibacter sp.]|nr:ABC transporter ATP-binding protein [Conexibacter sp.]